MDDNQMVDRTNDSQGVMRATDIFDGVRRYLAPQHTYARKGTDIACARFTVGTHQSETEASANATLFLSDKCSGRLHAAYSGQEICQNMKPGLLAFVPPGVTQTYDFDGVVTNTVLVLDTRLFTRATELSPELGTLGDMDLRAFFVRPQLLRLIEDHYRIMASGDLGWRVLAEASALSLARELFVTFSGRDQQQAGALPLTKQEIELLIDFIEAELENNFDLTDLAEVLDRNPFGFSRSFRAATGESPHQFVIQRRLAKAKDLLEHTDDALAEIAYATGFSNQSHMTATFSKHLGMPPGAYRKAVRG